MPDVTALVAGSEKLTRIFGGWPSFHDAEVHEMHLERESKRQRPKLHEFPRMTAKIHLWTSTKEVDHRGYYVLTNHTLVTMRFEEVDDLKLEGFNHQNVIFGIQISRVERDEEPSAPFAVDFDSIFGVGATFTCRRVEIISAEPFEVEGP